MAATICDLCKQPLDPDAGMTLRKISGYAGSRGSTGGVNSLKLKQEHDQYVHALCAERAKQGHRFGQAQLGGVA